jgi:hypothetical protein
LDLLTPYTFTQLWATGSYNAIAILQNFQFTVAHTLRFSVITSRILATDLYPFYCHFKSHMKSSFHFAIILQLQIPKAPLDLISLLPISYPGRLASRNSTVVLYSVASSDWPFITPRHGPRRKQFIVDEACLPRDSLAIDVLLSLALAPAGICLRSPYLAMGIHVTMSQMRTGLFVGKALAVYL